MLTRREFIRTAALFALAPSIQAEREKEIWVNDVHSQLNRTRVRELLRPRTQEELAELVRSASRKGVPISVSGCRHSMGGQQFATDSICIDTRSLDRVISFDQEHGLIEAEAGIQWPKLIRTYLEAEERSPKQWGIAQKQTGADTFTLAGSLSSNVHGRGLTMKPLISNVESFTLINADGKSVRCSRNENSELFRLAIGGYGLFGLIDSVSLRLVPRRKLRRVVEVIRADDLPRRFEQRIAQKFLYGDFQFSVDERSPDFLQLGVFSCYEPIDEDEPVHAVKELRDDDWLDLLRLAYTNRAKAFQRYSDYYLSTNGQTYWSDTNQLSAYLPNYAQRIREVNGGEESSLIITEIYVPRSDLPRFLAYAAELLRSNGTTVIYGTVRLIEKDNESFLAWAKESYACIIFNLLTFHTAQAVEASARSFRGLIDLAIARGGSYYLTYHKFAKPEQVMACYPQFKQFLDLKRKYDRSDRFQSDWYRYYRKLFAS
ncbi:MAG TPA: FAD-binding oxidoreductase [Candidatus Udaeobacter sp.]|jgi:FAD/FMN-containing dehydrogenase|nr:FAD-binding oxidoreductase [Candidatus Udaeobacter sp.]